MKSEPVVAAMRARQVVAEAPPLRPLVVAVHIVPVEDLMSLCLGVVVVAAPVRKPVTEMVWMLQMVVTASLPFWIVVVVLVWAARRD